PRPPPTSTASPTSGLSSIGALRCLFEANAIPLPDEELATELTHLRYKVVSANGKIRIEEEEETKKGLKRSPDRADSLKLADTAPPEGSSFSLDGLSRDQASPRSGAWCARMRRTTRDNGRPSRGAWWAGSA